jgi:hypothetical protein
MQHWSWQRLGLERRGIVSLPVLPALEVFVYLAAGLFFHEQDESVRCTQGSGIENVVSLEGLPFGAQQM